MADEFEGYEDKTAEKTYTEENAEEERSNFIKGAAGYAVKDSVNASVQSMNTTYAKPEYTGNRPVYDSQKAKVTFKKNAFSSGKVTDPYTGKPLEATIKQAKTRYGDNWAEHVAEADHVKPLKRIVDEYQDAPFTTAADIREAANQDANLTVTSRKVNNAKRDRTNEEFAGDTRYRKDKKVKLSTKRREQMKADGKQSDSVVNRTIRGRQVFNAAKEAHNAGVQSAKVGVAVGGALLLLDNIVALMKGEKTVEEAIADMGEDVLQTAVTSYGIGGALSAVGHLLSKSSSPFIRNLVKSGVPGQIVSVVMATGNTLIRYAKGEINTGECIRELGSTGVSMGVTGYAMTVGQVFIPVPFLGAAIGALVGGVICATLWNPLNASFTRVKEAQQRAELAEARARESIRRMEAWRLDFERAMTQFLTVRQATFDEGYYALLKAAVDDDYDGMVNGLNRICNAFGQSLPVQTFEEFDSIMSDKNLELEL